MKVKRKARAVTVVLFIAIIVTLCAEAFILLMPQFIKYGDIITLYIRVAFLIVGIMIFMTILLRSDNHGSKMPWLIFILLVPIFGVIIFLSFSNNFKKTMRYKKRKSEIHEFNYIKEEPITNFNNPIYDDLDDNIKSIFKSTYNMSKHHVYAGDSNVEVLNNGDEFFPKLLEKLEQAREYIIMEFFIIKTDEIGRKVLSILKEKAISGLKVILIYDSLGSSMVDKKFMSSLKESGVEICIFDKIKFPLFNSKINNRNHRKITVIDGKYSFVGGINLGDEYNHQSKKFGFWRDTHLLIEGPAINSSLEIINKDYYYITGEFLTLKNYLCTNKLQTKTYVQTIQSGPDSEIPIIRNTYIKSILCAKKSIKIITPYLVLDSEMVTALKTAASSGIDVKLIIPGKPDKKMVYKCSESFIETLLDSGVKVYKYKNVFTHAKKMIVDDKLASCGTFNFDIRSFIINFEVTTIFVGDAVNILVEKYEDDLLNSEEILLEDWKNRGVIKKFIEGVVNIFAPLM